MDSTELLTMTRQDFVANQTSRLLPFSKADQLSYDMDLNNSPTFLPGNPRIRLDHERQLSSFLRKDLSLGDLDALAPRLWIMTAPTHRNISPLHRQRVKRRDIIITEDHRLHLVWYYDRIFIKPLPRYLLSATFWDEYLLQENSNAGNSRERGRLSRAAMGYLRTYAYLVQHESDFRIAQRHDLQLIPLDVSWERWCMFVRHLDNIQDTAVAERYHYGEIRLSRLNFYATILLGKPGFHPIHWQCGGIFAHHYPLMLFIFAVIVLFLNAFQVELAVEGLDAGNQWISLWQAARYFSVIVLFFVLIVILWLLIWLVTLCCRKWFYTLRIKHVEKRSSRTMV